MAHHHDHSHSHDSIRSFNASFAIAVSLTLIYTLVEAGFAVYADSMSLLADAVHNFGDVLGLALAWLANWLLTIPARKRYSYGFKRISIIASLANAFILVGTSAIILYESIYKLMNPGVVNEGTVIIMGIIGIFVNIGTSLLFMRGARDDINIKGAFLHLMADGLILVGVVISAVIIHFTDLQWIDPVVGILIVVVILFGTWGLLRDSVILILDAIPKHIDHQGVRHYLQNYPGVKTVHDLHIWGLSTREVALTAHLVMPENKLSDAEYKKINEVLAHDFRINHVTLQVESGSEDDECVRGETC
jgi:cobalt-zinc-cadmium efflux system protein